MDKISEIIEEKKVVRLELDSGEELLFRKALWRKVPLLQINQEIDTEELKNWMLQQQYPYALHYAVDLLSRRSYASQEIAKKLRLRYDLEETAEMVIYKLEKEHILDDRVFAESYVESCVRKQYGKMRIRRALAEKGVDREIIEETLEALPGKDAEEAMVKLAVRLLRHYEKESDPRKKQAKLMAAMARKGYGYDEAKRALELAREE